MITQFTTYANVKAWLALTNDTDETMLTRLISEASGAILRYINRAGLYKATYADVYDGYGTPRFFLDQWPVLSVSSVVSEGITIPALPAPQTQIGYGYVLGLWNGNPPGQPQPLTFRGGRFPYGQANVAVGYTAGYSIQNEAQTVPASSAYVITALQPYGSLAQDDGVFYASTGVQLTPVTALTGAAGQYTLANGVYTFNSTDANAALLLNYSYNPYDIEQACIEIVGSRYRAKSRIDEKSHSQGGQETVSFDLSGISQAVKIRLDPYRRRVLM